MRTRHWKSGRAAHRPAEVLRGQDPRDQVPPRGRSHAQRDAKMVGGIDEQEQGWVAKCIANTTRWDYVLTPMEIFDPPEHHRRLELELLDNATIPRSDPRGTPVGLCT